MRTHARLPIDPKQWLHTLLAWFPAFVHGAKAYRANV